MPFDLSIVIACYKDAPHLENNVRRIRRIIEETNYRTEYIFVEDNGGDGSVEIIQSLTREIPESRAIFHESNTGRGRAVTDGFRVAQGEVAGFLDIDLAVSPAYIPLMVSSIRNDGYDVATAHRIYLNSFSPQGLFRDFLSWGYRGLTRGVLGIPFQDTETGYKFFRRSALLSLLDKAKDTGWFWDTEIMLLALEANLKVVEHRCLYIRDMDKASTVRVFRDVPAYLAAMRRFLADRKNRE